jgi:SAM-dependent methyltransferase
MLERTKEPTLLNSLLRWFWVGVPQDVSEAVQIVPGWFLEVACACKVLRNDGKQFVPEVMLVPFEDFLVASDRTSRFETAEADLVLWPNPTSRLLSRFTVRRPSRATLDIGTGTGVQALVAAKHSEKVMATDLNVRALALAAFNARLNGIENIEFRFGDGFAPVADQKFDLIVSNPPFFITPSDHYLFCDNPMELDQLCRLLARDAAAHLNEGGYFQMLCEWAEIQGEPWQEHVTEWFNGTGCDAWVLKGQSRTPSQYAQDRARETVSSPDQGASLYREYMAYYEGKNVEAIHDGIIAMRRNPGPNWVLIEQISHTPQYPFGDFVTGGFAARDFLQANSSTAQMLAMRPVLSEHARIEQVLGHGVEGWKGISLTLRMAKGLPFALDVQPLVAEFLGSCDGTRTLGELVEALAAKVPTPIEQVQKECIDVLRTLIARGYVLWK